jgi:hypothetical protein
VPAREVARHRQRRPDSADAHPRKPTRGQAPLDGARAKAWECLERAPHDAGTRRHAAPSTATTASGHNAKKRSRT